MAASVTTSRAIYAGLSCGFAFAVPVCAYAVTLPFPRRTVSSRAAPCRSPSARSLAWGSSPLCPPLPTIALEMSMSKVPPRWKRSTRPRTALFSSHGKREARAQHAQDGDVERFFGKRGVPRDVPVIARAAGAPSEAAAWADIDALFDDDSPISCDASRSKDIYQIAFEELRRGAVHAERPAGSAAATGRMTPMSARPAAGASTPHVAGTAHRGSRPLTPRAGARCVCCRVHGHVHGARAAARRGACCRRCRASDRPCCRTALCSFVWAASGDFGLYRPRHGL